MRRCPSCHSQLLDQAKFCTSCGTRLDARDTEEVEAAERDEDDEGGVFEPTQAADPLVHRVIGKNFRIDKLIGVGGMGKVYQATQLSLDKNVALKILHPQWARDDTQVHRFQREARAASRIEHPNIIQIIDFGQDDDGTLFMAMELLRGRDLSSVLREDFPLAEERLARIAMQICLALTEAHAQGVIHRDLKLGNVVVEDRGGQLDTVKLFDFGIAKLQDRRGRETRILTTGGVVCGTPEYMSPEQIRGQELDPRTDIYSLGIMLYQLATGQLPFSAENPIDIAAKHVTSRALPPRQVRGEVSTELEAIILRCLEKKREQRFQDAAELHASLALLAEGGRPRLDTPIEPASLTSTEPDIAVEVPIDGEAVGSAETTLDIPAEEVRSAAAEAQARADADPGDDEDRSETVTQIAASDPDPEPRATAARMLETAGPPALLAPDEEELTEEVRGRAPRVPDPVTLGTQSVTTGPAPGLLVALLVSLAMVVGALVGVIGWRLTHPGRSAETETARPEAGQPATVVIGPDAGAAPAPEAAADAAPQAVARRPPTPPVHPERVPQARPDRPRADPPAARPRVQPTPPPTPKPAPEPGTKPAVKMDLRRIEKLLRQGDIRHQAGDYEGALQFYEKARRLDGGVAKVYQKLALAHHNLGRFEEACDALDRFLTLRPHPPGEEYYRALVLKNCQNR